MYISSSSSSSNSKIFKLNSKKKSQNLIKIKE